MKQKFRVDWRENVYVKKHAFVEAETPEEAINIVKNHEYDEFFTDNDWQCHEVSDEYEYRAKIDTMCFPDLMPCPLDGGSMNMAMEVVMPDGQENIFIIKQDDSIESADYIDASPAMLEKLHDQKITVDEAASNPYVTVPGIGKIEIARLQLFHWSGLSFEGETTLKNGATLREQYRNLAEEWNQWG